MAATTWVRDASTWKRARKIYVNRAGTWTPVRKVYARTGGNWQLVYNSLFSFSVTNGTNVNLRTLANSAVDASGAGWDGLSDVQVTLFGTFTSNSAVAAQDLHGQPLGTPYTARPASSVITGVFPGTLTVLIDPGCIIAGQGGNGGSGGGDSGHPGGHALECSMDITLTNNGNCWGGGGGGSSPSGKYGGGGAGGGAGQVPGLGSAAQPGLGAGDGQNGTSTAGGAGGAPAPSGDNGVEASYDAGAGGGRGSDGLPCGSQIAGLETGITVGSAGYAIYFGGHTVTGTMGATLGPVG